MAAIEKSLAQEREKAECDIAAIAKERDELLRRVHEAEARLASVEAEATGHAEKAVAQEQETVAHRQQAEALQAKYIAEVVKHGDDVKEAESQKQASLKTIEQLKQEKESVLLEKTRLAELNASLEVRLREAITERDAGKSELSNVRKQYELAASHLQIETNRSKRLERQLLDVGHTRESIATTAAVSLEELVSAREEAERCRGQKEIAEARATALKA
jgi:chromosome segregation ATPase